jgi:hypothetical protein
MVLRSRIFDANWYVATYPVVGRQGWDPATHYLAVGAARGLKPHLLFEPDWYLARRPATVKNPLLDYITTGAGLRLDPSPYFHTAYYLGRSGRPLGNGLTPLGDFTSRGAGEQLFQHPCSIEVVPAQLSRVLKSGFDPFLHYVLR